MNNWLKRSIPEDNCFIDATQDELNNFLLIDERKVVNEVSHVQIDGKKMAPFKNNSRIRIYKKLTIGKNKNSKIYALISGQKFDLKEIKGILLSPVVINERLKIDMEKRKGKSFNKTISKKVYFVNKKITELNKFGHNITPLDISI